MLLTAAEFKKIRAVAGSATGQHRYCGREGGKRMGRVHRTFGSGRVSADPTLYVSRVAELSLGRTLPLQ